MVNYGTDKEGHRWQYTAHVHCMLDK
jgi:hypothetical protein